VRPTVVDVNVQVVCFGILRDHLPEGAVGNVARIEVASGAKVEDLASHLGIPQRQVFALLVNGERANLTQNLQEGDEVTLMPPFSGGRRPQG